MQNLQSDWMPVAVRRNSCDKYRHKLYEDCFHVVIVAEKLQDITRNSQATAQCSLRARSCKGRAVSTESTVQLFKQMLVDQS